MKRIEIKHVDKEFALTHRISFLKRILGLQQQKTTILKDINLQVDSGEIVGLVGRNGVGKSTLLRIIAKIYRPDNGCIITRGKIIPLLNLQPGLQWRLSVRDNIDFLGTIFGLVREEINHEAIISFGGLKEYQYLPAFKISEGMKQRLLFSLALHARGNILLLDEALEIGDSDFKKKSQKAVKAFAKNGGSVIIVSHDKSLIEKISDRIITLH